MTVQWEHAPETRDQHDITVWDTGTKLALYSERVRLFTDPWVTLITMAMAIVQPSEKSTQKCPGRGSGKWGESYSAQGGEVCVKHAYERPNRCLGSAPSRSSVCRGFPEHEEACDILCVRKARGTSRMESGCSFSLSPTRLLRLHSKRNMAKARYLFSSNSREDIPVDLVSAEVSPRPQAVMQSDPPVSAAPQVVQDTP
ncbi:hypothetical protein Bbelb_139430 [Branchiostoma belcheri]|nr:hypothetical protein Bbelb_139430 [Branchiostoma belcheri]